MRVIPIMPIETFYGKLHCKGKYYFRRSKKGTIYACRCPDRSQHVKTPAEAANQQRFAQQFAGSHKSNTINQNHNGES